ncbi:MULTISPECIES: dUTP diphosphatase [Sporosarcina]|uniref:dUTP diphosphatase n=1 Tax=Sporosarcina TaxID=1569 RepID=UPI0005905C42|nr:MULTISPECIES: dUTP diphosphatase [Sporosarcina]WJY27998.1 dUTP diphosphatase [Sporosarcina sp. 0.2-SM1T-5]
MELEKLFTMQEALDTYIHQQHSLSTGDLFHEKVLALLVELSELANETRCFKFWSTKGPSERSVILEEYVDSIHFLLSLGIASGLTAFNDWDIESTSDSLTAVFLDTNRAILHFEADPTMHTYTGLWTQYGRIAEKLGFTPDEIIAAYIDKNETNYERQKSGY